MKVTPINHVVILFFLLVGGRVANGQVVWTRITDSPGNRSSHTTARADPGILFSFGGLTETTLLTNGVERFQNNQWDPVITGGIPPSARAGHTAVAIGDTMVVFGGTTSVDISSIAGYTNELWLFVMNTQTWVPEPTTGAPPGRAFHTAIRSNTGIIVFGGMNGNVPLGDIHEWNEGSKQWTDLQGSVQGNLPSARYGHSAVRTGDIMIVYGGFTSTQNPSSAASNDVYLFDINTRGWRRATVSGTAPSPRAMHASVILGDNQMVVFGGVPAPDPNTWILNTQSLEWRSATSVGPPFRERPSFTNLSPSLAVLYGGNFANTFYRDTWSISLTCVDPGTPAGATRSGSCCMVGDTLSFVCNAPDRLVGSLAVTCQQSGLYDNPLPACAPPNQCIAPPTVANGRIITGSRDVGGSTTYACNTGYRLTGSPTITCQADGSYTTPTPICSPDCGTNLARECFNNNNNMTAILNCWTTQNGCPWNTWLSTCEQSGTICNSKCPQSGADTWRDCEQFLDVSNLSSECRYFSAVPDSSNANATALCAVPCATGYARCFKSLGCGTFMDGCADVLDNLLICSNPQVYNPICTKAMQDAGNVGSAECNSARAAQCYNTAANVNMNNVMQCWVHQPITTTPSKGQVASKYHTSQAVLPVVCNAADWHRVCLGSSLVANCGGKCSTTGVADWTACENYFGISNTCKLYTSLSTSPTAICSEQCATEYATCFAHMGCQGNFNRVCNEILAPVSNNCAMRSIREPICTAATNKAIAMMACTPQLAHECYSNASNQNLDQVIACWTVKGCDWWTFAEKCSAHSGSSCNSKCGVADNGVATWRLCEGLDMKITGDCKLYSVNNPNKNAICSEKCATELAMCFSYLGCETTFDRACNEILDETTPQCGLLSVRAPICTNALTAVRQMRRCTPELAATCFMSPPSASSVVNMRDVLKCWTDNGCLWDDFALMCEQSSVSDCSGKCGHNNGLSDWKTCETVLQGSLPTECKYFSVTAPNTVNQQAVCTTTCAEHYASCIGKIGCSSFMNSCRAVLSEGTTEQCKATSVFNGICRSAAAVAIASPRSNWCTPELALKCYHTHINDDMQDVLQCWVDAACDWSTWAPACQSGNNNAYCDMHCGAANNDELGVWKACENFMTASQLTARCRYYSASGSPDLPSICSESCATEVAICYARLGCSTFIKGCDGLLGQTTAQCALKTVRDPICYNAFAAARRYNVTLCTPKLAASCYLDNQNTNLDNVISCWTVKGCAWTDWAMKCRESNMVQDCTDKCGAVDASGLSVWQTCENIGAVPSECQYYSLQPSARNGASICTAACANPMASCFGYLGCGTYITACATTLQSTTANCASPSVHQPVCASAATNALLLSASNWCGASLAANCFLGNSGSMVDVMACWTSKGCSWATWRAECQRSGRVQDCSAKCGTSTSTDTWNACENIVNGPVTAQCRLFSTSTPNKDQVCGTPCATQYANCYGRLGCDLFVNTCLNVLESSTSTQCAQRSVSQPVCDAAASAAMLHVSCPRIGTIANGMHTPDQTQYRVGDIATVICAEGYMAINGNAALECTAASNWSAVLPTCSRQYCSGTFLNDKNGYFLPQYDNFGHGMRATVMCNPGYIRQGDIQLTCTPNIVSPTVGGLWEGVSTCVASQNCPAPSIINGSVQPISNNGVYSKGSTITITCNPSFVLVGSRTVTCTQSATWSLLPTCTRVECGQPTAPVNGRVRRVVDSVTGYGVGTAIQFDCQPGYYLIGQSTSVCLNTTFYSNPPPVCQSCTSIVEVSTCNNIPSCLWDTTTGSCVVPNWSCQVYNQQQCSSLLSCEWNVSTGTCGPTTQVICGSLVSANTCNHVQNCQWGRSTATCVAKALECNMAVTRVGCDVVTDYCDWNLNANTCLPIDFTAAVGCGYAYNQVTCNYLSSCNWATSTCVNVVSTCPTVSAANSQSTITTSPNGGDVGITNPPRNMLVPGVVVTVTCQPGFALSGNNKLTCLPSFNWQPTALPVCQQSSTTCNIVRIPQGNVTPNSTVIPVGQRVTYSCVSGYTLIGEPTVECMPDATLGPAVPRCESSSGCSRYLDAVSCVSGTRNCEWNAETSLCMAALIPPPSTPSVAPTPAIPATPGSPEVPSTSDDESSLSAGYIVLIVIGVVAAILLLMAFLCCMKKNTASEGAGTQANTEQSKSIEYVGEETVQYPNGNAYYASNPITPPYEQQLAQQATIDPNHQNTTGETWEFWYDGVAQSGLGDSGAAEDLNSGGYYPQDYWGYGDQVGSPGVYGAGPAAWGQQQLPEPYPYGA